MRSERDPDIVLDQSQVTDNLRNTLKSEARFSRSRQMVQALRQEFLYSEKRARDILFAAIEAILHRHAPPMIVSRVAREVAARARSQAQQAGYYVSNWDTTTKATMNAMLRAGVLLAADGRPIRHTIAAQATEVAALAERFQDLTEAHLLEAVIRKLGDVTARDHVALAHALFRQFDQRVSMEDLEDRVVYLLASLSDRVVMLDDGTYSTVS